MEEPVPPPVPPGPPDPPGGGSGGGGCAKDAVAGSNKRPARRLRRLRLRSFFAELGLLRITKDWNQLARRFVISELLYNANTWRLYG
jgi:hypothetical protein